MPPDPTAFSKEPNISTTLEITHVLFMDIVGYSKLSADAQMALVKELSALVHSTSDVQKHESAGSLLFRPTGDGMALVFFRDPLAPVRCALEIAWAIKQRPQIQLRMGIHSGPVYRVQDINSHLDVSGDGIVTAQRVMDCGDAGHILLSDTVGLWLNQLVDWSRCLEDLGLCKVKQGGPLHLFNLYVKESGLGNRAHPKNAVPAEKEKRRRRRDEGRVSHHSLSARDTLVILFWSVLALSVCFGLLWAASPSFREQVEMTLNPDQAAKKDKLAKAEAKGGKRKKSEAYRTTRRPRSGGVSSAGVSSGNDSSGKAATKSGSASTRDYTFSRVFRVPTEQPSLGRRQVRLLCSDGQGTVLFIREEPGDDGDTFPVRFAYQSNVLVAQLFYDDTLSRTYQFNPRDPSTYPPFFEAPGTHSAPKATPDQPDTPPSDTPSSDTPPDGKQTSGDQ